MIIPAYTKRENRAVKIIAFVTDERSAIAVCTHFDGTIHEYRIGELLVEEPSLLPITDIIIPQSKIDQDIFNAKEIKMQKVTNPFG